MKVAKKRLLAVITTMLLICCFSTSAFAASTVKDGIDVTVTTNQGQYSKEDTAKFTVKVTNYNDYDVSDIELSALIPETLKVVSGENELNKKVSLAAGESQEYSFSVVQGEVAPQPAQDAQTEAVNETVVNNGDQSADEALATEAAAVTASANPDTGDRTMAVLFVIAGVGGLAIFGYVAVKHKKKAAKVLSVVLCVAMTAPMLASLHIENVKAATQKVSTTTSTTISIGDTQYEIRVTASFDAAVYNTEKTYTKGEWISLLEERMNLSTDLDDSHIYYYGDTQNSEYGNAIEAAQSYGLLPAADSDGYEDPDQDIPMFNETQTVTREFAAYTAVKALGFTGDFELNCDDSAALKYTSEDAIAIKQGMLSLEDNCFKPESPLTEQDKNSIFAVFTKVATTSDLSNVTQTESTVYADGVIQGSLNSVTDYTVVYNDDNTITVTVPDNTATSAIQTGDVFVLPSTQQCVGGIALKAISSQKNGDNIVLECSRPEMAETYSHIGFTGNGTPEVGNITTGTGVTYSYSEDTQEQDVEYGSFSYGGSTAIPGDLTFYTDIKDGLPYNGSINGYVTIKIPDVTAKVDGSVGWTGIDIDDFIISVTEKTVISMDIKTSVSQGDDDTFLPAVPGDGNGGGSTKHELGHIPIALGATGLSVDIVPILNVDIYGRASIDFSMTTTAGFQYVNGTPRIIADGTSSLDNLAISATAKFGVGAGVHLKAASVFDLIGFDLHGGIGLNASFTAHPEVTPVLYCSDAACYMYLDLDLNSDTIVGGLIKMACGDVSWYIFTEDNSPLKKIVHLENGKKVNACTFAPGALHGYVASTDNNAPIENARVSIYKGDQLIYSGFTNAFGVYDLTSINSGTYTVRVAATGYAAYTSSITVETGRTAYAENLLLIDREHSGEGTVKGLIKNAVTGNAVTDVKYTVYKNWDVTSGDKLAEATSDDGNYVVTLPAGNYTVVFEKDGFVTANVNITVQENEAVVKDAAMSPVGGNISIGDNIIRCVLTWGLTPRDLDSHLFGPTVNGTSTFHTYYVNKNYREAGEIIANLDLDDTTSYGPETTTVYKKNTEGTYSYFVHDYTNRWTDSSDMLSKSGAQVKVYAGDTLLATYNVPYNVEGTLWHVFDYDAATDVLTPVNEMTYSRMPDTSVLIRRSLELEQLYQSGSPEELKDYEIEEQNAAAQATTENVQNEQQQESPVNAETQTVEPATAAETQTSVKSESKASTIEETQTNAEPETVTGQVIPAA